MKPLPFRLRRTPSGQAGRATQGVANHFDGWHASGHEVDEACGWRVGAHGMRPFTVENRGIKLPLPHVLVDSTAVIEDSRVIHDSNK